MEGARFMSCYMGPILAGHLRDIHEDMKIKKQLAANNFEKLSWCENDVKMSSDMRPVLARHLKEIHEDTETNDIRNFEMLS